AQGPGRGARQLQDRPPPLQHGSARLQALPQLPPQARLSAAVQGVPVMMRAWIFTAGVAALVLTIASSAAPQTQTVPPRAPTTAPAAAAAPVGVAPPADYVIGPEDALSVVFWRDKELSAEVVVRPDGKISLPLLNDVQAAGLTPEQLRLKLIENAKKYIEDPNATVVVRQINSRKV